MVFFREIFIWQLLGLVLTYNFTDCDFKEIEKEYQGVIWKDLQSYMNGAPRNTCTDCPYCQDKPDCLTKIERLTFDPSGVCKSLAKEMFAVRTNDTFTRLCPGYSGIQITNNTQASKKRKKRENIKNNCWDIVTKLIGLWTRFHRKK